MRSPVVVAKKKAGVAVDFRGPHEIAAPQVRCLHLLDGSATPSDILRREKIRAGPGAFHRSTAVPPTSSV